MLRITRLPSPDGSETLKLEGKISGEGLDELARVVETSLAAVSDLRLDLAGVTFVDADGVALLRGLTGRSARIVDSSAFVAEMLRRRTS